MAAFRYKDWRIAFVAAFFALVPVTAGNIAIERYSTLSAVDAVHDTAEATLRRIDYSLDAVTSLIEQAAGENIGFCSVQDVAGLQAVVARSLFVKDLIMTSRGLPEHMACSNAGLAPFDAEGLMARASVSPVRGVGIIAETLQGSPQPEALRLIRRMPASGRVISALVPVALAMPERLTLQGDSDFSYELSFSDGRLIHSSLPRATNGAALIEEEVLSVRYPLRLVIRAVPSDMLKPSSGLYRGARVATGLVGLLAGLLIYTFLRRRESDPLIRMQNALENNEFIAYYQPIVNLQSGALVGCEVLVRWRLPSGEMVPPGAFIATAEHSGFIFPLTLAVMRRAVADLGAVYATRADLKCGFNLCAQHFKDERIVDDVIGIFADSFIHPEQVYLEVTERDPLPDLDVARRIIGRFQNLGMRVALDDVGTGHGGMSYLLKLGVDMMKIDKLFIDGLGQSDHSAAIIDSLLDLGRHMNLSVVAEGVEKAVQVEELRKRGVTMAQGYFFAQPMPASSFVALIEAMVPAHSTPGQPPSQNPLPMAGAAALSVTNFVRSA